MPPSLPLHRHQSSLEGVIDFSAELTLGTDQRTNAKRRFYHIVEYFEAANSSSSNDDYSRPRLVHFTYDYALSEESRDNFLRAFFRAMALSIDGEEDIDVEDLRSPFFGFADYLLDNFFLPLKASTKRTPQPSPAFHSAVQRVQGGDAEAFAGTPDRVSALRGACLIRDRHRCVISRKFDLEEAAKRMQRDGDDARDDDGVLLLEDANPVDVLEVAHILPHSLMKADTGSELNPSKQAALAILNMFDSGIIQLIEGVDIDRPRNAITLTHTLHWLFGDFRLFFEPTPDRQPHTYRISSFYPPTLLRDPAFPITRTLYLTGTRTIDPPSPRLLAVHRAIAHILHLSAAGDYIDKLLRDMDGKGIQADGSTELDRLVKLRLGGWLDGPIYS
uniref:HNH nuclease domain-containing protein n=1 Tax=Bionectria ochroleuca TaxID=29856 RepID=A0A0B7KKY2_BIOOC